MKKFEAMSLIECYRRYGSDEGNGRLYEISERLSESVVDDYPWAKPIHFIYFLSVYKVPYEVIDGEFCLGEPVERILEGELARRDEEFFRVLRFLYDNGCYFSPWEQAAYDPLFAALRSHSKALRVPGASEENLNAAEALLDGALIRIRRWSRVATMARESLLASSTS